MSFLMFDLVIAALLLLFLWRGYRRGFVLTLCGFLAVFVALVGAAVLSDALAEPLGKAIVPMVESNIQHSLEEAIQQSGQTDLSGQSPLPEDLPLSGLLSFLRGTEAYQKLMDSLQSAIDDGVASVAAAAARMLAEYAAVQLARTVLFFVCFIGVLIAWFLLSHTLDLVAKLPVLSTLNRWGGGAIGLLKGALVIYIACWLLKDLFIPPEAVEGTRLLKFFCTTSPLSFFF